MGVTYRFLLNFAPSYSGGGLKRLYEFAKWFDANGGAWFVIHPVVARMKEEFPNNKYWIADQPRYQRLLNDCSYLPAIEDEVGRPDLYYAYGIPIYRKVGVKNWFHLSNVLPLVWREPPLSPFDRVKFKYLGSRIRANLHNADVISAESGYSLSLIGASSTKQLIVSVNGSDEELAYMRSPDNHPKTNIATVVGTYGYKRIEDSFRVFETLHRTNAGLRLVIIGDPEAVPKSVRRDARVDLRGSVPRAEVIKLLHGSKYYISSTRVENSFNAASEGIAFSEEAFISDIPPHRELLTDTPFSEVTFPGTSRPMLHVVGRNLSRSNLRTWDEVVRDMIDIAAGPA